MDNVALWKDLLLKAESLYDSMPVDEQEACDKWLGERIVSGEIALPV